MIYNIGRVFLCWMVLGVLGAFSGVSLPRGVAGGAGVALGVVWCVVLDERRRSGEKASSSRQEGSSVRPGDEIKSEQI